MERIQQSDSPALIDRVITDLQSALSAVSWLDHIFGRARRQVRQVKGREAFFPAVYVGNGEYRSVFPDEMDGNFVWFDVPDYYDADVPYMDVASTVRMIFWFDEETIFGRGISNRDQLKEDVLRVLEHPAIRGGRFEVLRIGEWNENIYRGYSLREVESQHLIFPHGGFVVEGKATATKACGPRTPPVYIDTTAGTITPETVLAGEIGFAKGERIVGTLDISSQIEEAIDEGTQIGRAEIISEQADATITADKVLAGEIGYGADNMRIVGSYTPGGLVFPPERTKLWLEVETNPWIGQTVVLSITNIAQQHVVVDWGDGQTWSTAIQNITASKTYATSGKKLISITPTEGMLLGVGASSYRIVGRNDTNQTKSIRKIFAPAGVGVQYYCLTDCDSIEYMEFGEIQNSLPASSIGPRSAYSLILHNPTPPATPNGINAVFTNVNLLTKIYVPDESVDLYKAAWVQAGLRNAIYPLSEYSV